MEIAYNADMQEMQASINDGTVAAIAPYLEMALISKNVPTHFFHPLVLGNVAYMLDTVDGDPDWHGKSMPEPLPADFSDLIHSRPPNFMYKKYLEIGQAIVTMVINYDTKMAYVTDHDKFTFWLTW